MDLADHRTAADSAGVPSLDELARDALASCHADLLKARETVLSSRDADGIHGTRVALRRLRAGIALFDAILADEMARALRGDAKQLADACGDTRDLDVFLAGVLGELEARLTNRSETADELRAFRATALRLRRARHDAVRQVLAGDVFAVFDARLVGLISARRQSRHEPLLQSLAPPVGVAANHGVQTPPPGTIDFARAVLRRRDRKLRKQLDRLDELDESARHALRLRVKKQRYAATFLAGLFDRKAAAAYIRGAAGLQDALGLANDRVVAAHVVADIRAAARPKGRLDWIAGMIAGALATRGQSDGGDERAVAVAAKRFVKAPRFWRRGKGGEDGVRL
ncbi:MAG: CHAD domain-containing protein [Alphaproteobacteria bacterium]|nr:CHAD domain-containing protein [Alphaproteobacteria bacterium]